MDAPLELLELMVCTKGSMRRTAFLLLIILCFTLMSPVRGEEAPAALKSETFDRDPGWEELNNHIEKAAKTVAQDFGYRDSNIAGSAKGEIGGTVWRSATTASYGEAIERKTLSDRLSASGTFAITASSGSSGVFFGFFKSEASDSGRQNSLGIHVAGQGEGCRLTLQLVTGTNQACGTKITPWVVDKTKARGEGRKVRPPAIKNDGTRYTWKLDYDPDASGGNGAMSFVIRSNSNKPEAFEGKTFTVALPKGYKDQGTMFDRFGLVNGGRPGNSLSIYFDDLEIDGTKFDFGADPNWIGTGNHAKYDPEESGGAHNFGFSEKTNFAGGAPGEIGGILWRSGSYAYYADRIGPLSLNDRLEASGKVILEVGPPDSGMYFGWFNSAEKEMSPAQAGQFLGVKIGGPTRIGHYFAPAYATTQDKLPEQGDLEQPPTIAVERGTGPVLVPRKVFEWKVVYDPSANGGKGEIEVTLGDESVKLPLKDGDKAKGAQFDRFGLFTNHRGGSFVKIYFDDFHYTASATR